MLHINRPPLRPDTQAFIARRGAGSGLLIDGAWREAQDGATLATLDPATGVELARISDASTADVDDAVAAARRALPGWRATTPVARARILWAIADLIEAHIDELAELETLDQGKPLFVGRWAEIPGAVNQFRFYAGQAMAIEGQTLNSSIDYQPQGKQVST